MSKKHKRTWSIAELNSWAPKRQRKSTLQEREECKRDRVQRMIDEGITKEDWECMQDHPGKYCNDCNPRIKYTAVAEQLKIKEWLENSNSDEADEDSEDIENDDDEEGYVMADLSEPWSDTSSEHWTDYFYSPTPSLTCSQIFDEKAREAAVVEHWNFSIERVDKVADRLEALDYETLKDAPIGGLRGRWYLYSLDHQPYSLDEASFYSRLDFTDDAVEGRLPSRERMTKSPFDSYIDLAIGNINGDITPFTLPSHPSLKAIPIGLMIGQDEDVPAEIVFLGSDCLRFRAPRSTLFPKNPGTPGSTIEFAGLRETEAEIEKIEREGGSPG